MAINPHSPQVSTSRPTANTNRAQPNTSTAPTTSTGPVDAVEIGASRNGAATPNSGPTDFSQTPGGMMADFVLQPDATRWYTRTRRELHEARNGTHSSQTAWRGTNRLRESNRMHEAERTFATIEGSVAEQIGTAEEQYGRAEQKAAGGFRYEQVRFDHHSQEAARAEQAFDRGVGASTREKLDRYEDLSRRLDAGEFSDSMAPNYRSFLNQLGGELRQKGINVAELRGEQTRATGSPQRLAQELIQSRDKLAEVSDFPRTEEGRAQWLKEQATTRDQAISQAEGRLEAARSQLASQRASVRSELAADESQKTQELVSTLEASLSRNRDVSLYNIRPEFKNAEALKQGGYINVRLSDNGIEARSYKDDQPPATFRRTQDGGMVIEAKSDRQEATSTFTPDGDAFRESSVVRDYSTINGQRRLSRETVQSKDGNGEVVSRTQTRHEHDGGRRVETFEKTPNGQRTSNTTIDSNGRTTYSYDRSTETVDGVTTEKSRTESSRGVETIEEVRNADGTKRKQTELERPDGTNYRNVMNVDSQGNASSRTRDERKDSNGNIVVTERTSENGKLLESRTTQTITPDTDVPGLGWIGSHNPQDLVERLGDEDRITGEKTTISRRNPDGTYSNQETITMRSGDGRKELIQSQGPHGGNAWELREKNSDGTWDSQVFLQGSNDTIITRSRKEDGFTIEERTSRTPDLAKKNPNVPAESSTTTRTAEAASADQVRRALSKSSVAEIANTDTFANFMSESGGGPFQVVSTDSEAGGKESSSFIMEAPDGRKLAAVYDEEKKTYTVKTFDAEGQTSGLAAVTRVGNQFERLEVDKDGKVQVSVSSATGQARNWVRVAEDVITAPSQVAKGVRAVSRLDQALLGSTGTGRLGQLSSVLADGKWASRIGVGAGGAAALLSGMSLTADLMSGDYASATRTAGTLGLDIATISKSVNADAFMTPAKAGSNLGRWASQGSRYLGAAGAITSVVFAGVDAYNGDYVRAGLGVASAGGAALALFGTASIAGPLGWGVAGAASLAMMAWDYNSGTRVAPYQL